MEIIVQGKAEDFFKPDEALFFFEFNVKGNSYEEVLSQGVNNVDLFIKNILLLNGFKMEDLKTRSFVVREDYIYNEITRKNDFNGYIFNQSATLKFDYDKNRMATLMERISKMSNAPKYQLSFGIKNEKECKRTILSKAYQDAKLQAEAIASAAGKTLKDCVKVDFKPFTTTIVSESYLDSDMAYAKSARFGAAPTIINTFTPEDIKLTETLYCLWIAE